LLASALHDFIKRSSSSRETGVIHYGSECGAAPGPIPRGPFENEDRRFVTEVKYGGHERESSFFMAIPALFAILPHPIPTTDAE